MRHELPMINRCIHVFIYLREIFQIYEYVMSHIQKAHVTHEWDVMHLKWVMPHIRMTRMDAPRTLNAHWSIHVLFIYLKKICRCINASCHTYECITSRKIYTCMNASCHTYECITSHIWMSHVTHIDESCHAYEWRTWMHHEPPMMYRSIYIFINLGKISYAYECVISYM